MSIVVSVLTNTDLVHVSDLPPEGPRTLLLRHAPRSLGLLTVLGEAPPLDWAKAEAADPRHEALALAQHLTDRAGVELGPDEPRGLLLTGWGRDREGREHSYRYLVGNLGEDEGFRLDGESITPDRVLRRHATAPYSLQVVMTVEEPPSTRRRVEALPRLIKKGDMSAVALHAAELVREVVPGPVLLAHLTPDGELEAAVLDGEALRAVTPEAATGTARLLVG